MQNFSCLACLEVAEKFVVGWWWWWWSRPVLGFSFSQAEQYKQNEKIPTEVMIAMTRTTQPVKMSVEDDNQVDGLLGHN